MGWAQFAPPPVIEIRLSVKTWRGRLPLCPRVPTALHLTRLLLLLLLSVFGESYSITMTFTFLSK